MVGCNNLIAKNCFCSRIHQPGVCKAKQAVAQLYQAVKLSLA